MIPKFAHSVWVGNKPQGSREEGFLAKRREILPDYTHIVWNNENLPSLIGTSHPLYTFVSRALDEGKYAFASDAIKLAALDSMGGIALDADNEVLLPFEKFLHHRWFSGFELYPKNKRKFPITAVWGAIPNHSFTNKLMDIYIDGDYSWVVSRPNTEIISKILIDAGCINDDSEQYVSSADVYLYPSFVLCTPQEGKTAYAIHHFSKSWG